jgi:branched-subunit amino acid aminotransferase/4-amino-4-deoxychorismate lyase
MRKQIFRIAAANKILVFETPITVNTIMNGDEIFLTSSTRGIQWVGQFKNKFFTNSKAVYFTEKLNEAAK